MKRSFILPLILAACATTPDFSPADLDFNDLKIMSADDAYEVFVSSAYAVAIAENLGDDCPDFGFDMQEAEFVRIEVEDNIASYFSTRPLQALQFIFRMTGDTSIQTLEQLNNDENVRISRDVGDDVVSRIAAYYTERERFLFSSDEAFACASANIEKQSGSLIGRFLFRD